MIEKYYTQSFTQQTWTASATFPFEPTWTDGLTFKGALDTVSSNERWADAQLVAISSHWIATKANLNINKADRIKLGSRIFEVTGVPDPVYLRANHHQEIYVKERT